MKVKGTKGKSKAVQTISDILFCFKDGSGILGVTEIAQKLGLYTSKIHRVVSTLAEQGLLEQNPVTKKYKIGLNLFEIGSLYPLNLNVRRIAYPHALAIAKMFETNVHLGILSKSVPYSLVVIERVINLQSSDSIRRISFNIPLHSSAMGKVFLAFLDKKTADSIIQNIQLEKYTANTITSKSTLEEELKLIRSQGYALDRGETHTNLYCIAAPIKDQNGIAAAISVSDVRQKVTKRRDEIVRNIIETADFISYQLGE